MSQPPEPREADCSHAAALIGLLLIGVLFFSELIFTNGILPRGDIYLFFYPQWQFRHELLRAGQIPLWNPYLYMGAPFLADIQNGVLYPPNWLLNPFDAPQAVKAALVMHGLLAALGTYLFAKDGVGLKPMAAMLAGVAFAFGGYLGAQAEHINQFQGLAWMPLIFWLAQRVQTHPRTLPALAGSIAMLLLAGHTQSAFIAGVGLGCWMLMNAAESWFAAEQPYSLRGIAASFTSLGWLALAATLALGIAAAQLLPTAELTELSNRSGGLSAREALAFSLKPQLIGRVLLPNYNDTLLFTEYVGYVGIVGLVLAGLAIIQRMNWSSTRKLLVVLVVGGFLALGAYNPINWLIVDYIPGFDLFRTPARWWVLAAFALALLAGQGFELMTADHRWYWLTLAVFAAAPILGLAGLAFLAPLGSETLPGAFVPATQELIIWAITLALTLTLLYLNGRIKPPWLPSVGIAALLVVELFVASQNLPYNDLVSPQIFDAQRPSISTLLADSVGEAIPGRYLSISDILFEPGDQREMIALYDRYLTEREMLESIASAKHRDVISPNLSMIWGIAAMDGYGGGLLPLADFTRFSSLMAGQEAPPDGRLRESLDRIPDYLWLERAGVRWVITDKIADAWVEGVYHDLQNPLVLHDEQPRIQGSSALPFETDSLSVIYSLPEGDRQAISLDLRAIGSDDPIERVAELGDGAEALPDTLNDMAAFRQIIPLGETASIFAVMVGYEAPLNSQVVIQGISLLDTRTGAFVPMSLSAGEAEMRLAYTGDVKIYEFETISRLSLTCNPILREDDESAWDWLAQGEAGTVIVEPGNNQTNACTILGQSEIEVTQYTPTFIDLRVSVSEPGGYLVLNDSWYPGWEAQLDGEAVPIRKANGLFRAVFVPAGQHRIEMRYRSRPFETGLWISGGSLLLTLSLLWLRWPRPSRG